MNSRFRNGFEAFFLREMDAGRASRSLIAFPVVLLLAGLSPIAFGNISQTAELYLLQALLYLVPLFGIVTGTSAAQADTAEAGLLASLPASRLARISGKFSALFLLFAVAQLGLFLPSLLAGAPALPLLQLWAYGIGIGAVFLALGLMMGFLTDDGVRAHLLGLGLWLLMTFGFGLIAWILTAAGWAAEFPVLWLLFLGSSPLEAMRIGVLFNVEALPFSADSVAAIGRFWIEHPGWWFGFVAALWTVGGLSLARPRRG